MRTLHLLASADRRGAEVFGTELARSLAAGGDVHEVVALAPATRAGSGLDVEVVEALRRPAALVELRRRAAQADVILGHGSKGLVGGTIGSVLARTPFVYRSIGDPAYWGSSWSRRARVGVQLRRAAAVGALWPEAAALIASRYRLPPERVHVLPNAVPADRFAPPTAEDRRAARADLGLDDDQPVVLFLGALSPEKRFGLVAAAVAALPDAVLLVAGDGPDRDAVAAEAARLLPGRHRLVGSVADPVPLLHAADVLALLSVTEGQPGVIIEAGLCGLPVVATSVGGVESLIVDGETGVIVRDADPATAATALIAAIRARVTLGSRARERCSREFTLEAVAPLWDALLHRVITLPRG